MVTIARTEGKLLWASLLARLSAFFLLVEGTAWRERGFGLPGVGGEYFSATEREEETLEERDGR